MGRKRLKQEDQFIPGIFNYCDRWCERCPYTQRCRSFAMQREIEGEIRRRDKENEAFWAVMQKTLGDAVEEIAQHADSLKEIDPPEDPTETLDRELFSKKMKQQRREIRRHVVARVSNDYFKSVQRWFKAHPEFNRDDRPKQGQPIDDAVDVIAWYYIFIHVKLSRALSGLIKDENDDFGLDDMVDEDGKPFPKDSDGSAKIAIIGIERSISAWSILREHLASEGAAAMGFMTHLLRLRNLVERYFPDARQFHRPGFDD